MCCFLVIATGFEVINPANLPRKALFQSMIIGITPILSIEVDMWPFLAPNPYNISPGYETWFSRPLERLAILGGRFPFASWSNPNLAKTCLLWGCYLFYLGGTTMEMHIVNSSAISAVGYDMKTGRMKITFKQGRTYDFCNVPEDVFRGLLTASSKGSYYNSYIKDRYQCF